MRIRSPSGWGLRKRAGEAAAPLFPPTANRRQAVLAREPRIRVDGQDANAAPTRFPVGTTAMNPSTAPAYPKAGLSKCRFQPQVFTRLFHVKHLFQPSLCCAKQTSPGKISPRAPNGEKASNSEGRGSSNPPGAPRWNPAASTTCGDAKASSPPHAQPSSILPNSTSFRHSERRNAPKDGRGREGRARLTRDRAPARRTGRTRG